MNRAKRKIARAVDCSMMQPLEPRVLMSTYHVNTLADNTTPGGTQTLREAIALANAHPGSTIILDKTGTYNLTDSDSGSTELDITASVTIESASGKASNTYINGNYTGGVFDITSSTGVINVTIDNITIQNGLVDGAGGGIFMDQMNAGNLTLSGDVICNNNSSDLGGGVAVGPGDTLYVTGCTFLDNISGRDGGGLAYYGNNLTVYKSTFQGNESGGSGGGISMIDLTGSFNPSAKFAYDNLISNTAQFQGGGIYFGEFGGDLAPTTTVKPKVTVVTPVATVKLVSMCFSGNDSGWEGGGLCVTEGSDELEEAVLPAQMIEFTVPINLSISQSQFTQNFGSSGGGVYCEDVDSVSVDSSSFTNNKGDYSGGGLTVYDQDNFNLEGGLPDNTNNSVKVTNSTFTGNYSSSGGGIFLSDATCVTIDHTNVSTNHSTYNGAGIFYSTRVEDPDEAHPITFTLTNDTINGNISGGGEGDGGGGVYFDDRGAGGAASVTISNTKITNNKIGGEGGGLYLEDDDDTDTLTVTMTQDTVSGNTSTGEQQSVEDGGGGAYIETPDDPADTVQISKSTFATNRTTMSGGGLYVEQDGGETDITACTFNNNTAAVNGAGLSTGLSAGTINLTNDTIANNAAADNGGGLYENDSTMVNLVYDTIAGNSAHIGGGVFNGSGTVSVLDTIIATNIVVGPATNGPDVSGAFVDEGHNLIGASDGSTGFTVSTIVGTAASKKNPMLKPLASNGGPTQTMAIPQNGLADDHAAPVAGITTDQRGYPRTSTPAIGAYDI